MTCSYCQLNTAMQHETSCPLNPLNQQENALSTNSILIGWICPRCHAARAPWVRDCDCLSRSAAMWKSLCQDFIHHNDLLRKENADLRAALNGLRQEQEA